MSVNSSDRANIDPFLQTLRDDRAARERQLKYQRDYYQRRKQRCALQGLCIACLDPSPGATYCKECRAYKNRTAKERYMRKRDDVAEQSKDEARRSAIEECARICETVADANPSRANTAYKCATKIRELLKVAR